MRVVLIRGNGAGGGNVAIVPRIIVAHDPCDRVLVQTPVAGLDMPRRTLMISRAHGYLSESSRELIIIVRSFNRKARVAPVRPPARRRA